jgi:hypothetical protein
MELAAVLVTQLRHAERACYIIMPTPTTNFSIFDGQELVTYAVTSGPTINDVPAVRRPLTQSRQRNIERYLDLEATDIILHLDNTPLAAADLAAGDTITDADAATYTVIFVERQVLKNTVAVVCRPVP